MLWVTVVWCGRFRYIAALKHFKLFLPCQVSFHRMLLSLFGVEFLLPFRNGCQPPACEPIEEMLVFATEPQSSKKNLNNSPLYKSQISRPLFVGSSKLRSQLDISLTGGYTSMNFTTSWWYFTRPTDESQGRGKWRCCHWWLSSHLPTWIHGISYLWSDPT